MQCNIKTCRRCANYELEVRLMLKQAESMMLGYIPAVVVTRGAPLTCA